MRATPRHNRPACPICGRPVDISHHLGLQGANPRFTMGLCKQHADLMDSLLYANGLLKRGRKPPSGLPSEIALAKGLVGYSQGLGWADGAASVLLGQLALAFDHVLAIAPPPGEAPLPRPARSLSAQRRGASTNAASSAQVVPVTVAVFKR